MISGIWPSSTDVPLLFPGELKKKNVVLVPVADSWVTFFSPFVP